MEPRFEARLRLALAALEQRGISPLNAAPPLYRLFWKRGWKLRPPLFASFLEGFIVHSLGFGLMFAPVMWLFVWGAKPSAALNQVFVIGLFGSGPAFGLLLGICLEVMKRWYRVPKWDDLGG